ncbi:SFH1 (YLR321C) [Zygosaccharomyces parabailii]|nr:SFH1 (YLR321C) [Zygosaccharomyces parabailii]CDH15437.1 related to Chromatin structure-remodeling complex subunit SFH1 [Zygosaccharomyces bailii ISA1307]
MSQQQLLPQAYLSNFHNRIRNEQVPLFVTAQPTRGHKRAKVVNYAEFDPDIFDEFANMGMEEDDTGEKKESANGSGTPGMGLPLNAGSGGTNGDEKDGKINGDGGSEANGGNNHTSTEEQAFSTALPDIQEQDDRLSILRYPKIRETFLQSKIAVPYRLDIPPTLSADQQEPIIIPITLSFEHGGHQINDFFSWNINDRSITPDEFATIYCRDLDFPNSTVLHSQIVSSINEQLQEYETVAAVVVPDLQVIVNLTCSLDNRLYEDNFQWNLNDKSISPEKFAEIVVQDLGLPRDFMPAIAHAHHEYLLRVKKEWLEGHLNQEHVPNGAAFGFLSGIRLDVDELGVSWCPKVEVLTQEEIQKREIEKERNLRRLKRESDRMHRRGRRRVDDLETTMRI